MASCFVYDCYCPCVPIGNQATCHFQGFFSVALQGRNMVFLKMNPEIEDSRACWISCTSCLIMCFTSQSSQCRFPKLLVKLSLKRAFLFSFDFSVSLPEVQRRTLDVAVKNSGGFLSKDKGLLGKVSKRHKRNKFITGWCR